MADLSSSTGPNPSKQYMVRMEAWNNLMMTEMNKLRLEQKHCDVVLTAENKIIYAHRIVLTVGSRLFRNLLANTNYSQYKELHITLPKDITFAAVDTLISFMYTGSLSLNMKVLPQIYKASHYFIMDHVVQICNAYSRMNNNPVLPIINNLQPPSSPKNIQKPAVPIKPTIPLPKKQTKLSPPRLTPLKRKLAVQSLNSVKSLKSLLKGKVAVVMLEKLKAKEIESWCKPKKSIKVEPNLILGPQVIIPAIDIKQEPIECDEPYIDEDITIEEPMIYVDKDVSIIKEFNTVVTIKKEPLDEDDVDNASGKGGKTDFSSSKNMIGQELPNSEISANINSTMPSRNENSGNINNASLQDVNNYTIGNPSEPVVTVINQTSINENTTNTLSENNSDVGNISDGNTSFTLNNKSNESAILIKSELFTSQNSNSLCDLNSMDLDNTSDGVKKSANCTQIEKLNEQRLLSEMSVNVNSANTFLPYQNGVKSTNENSDPETAFSYSHEENIVSKIENGQTDIKPSCILNDDVIHSRKETLSSNENLNELMHEISIKNCVKAPCDYDEHSNDVPSISSEHSYSKQGYSQSSTSSDSEEIDVCGISDNELNDDDDSEFFRSLIGIDTSPLIFNTSKYTKSKILKKIVLHHSINNHLSHSLRLHYNLREQKRRIEHRNNFLVLKEILIPNSRPYMTKSEILSSAIETIQQMEMEGLLFENDKQVEKRRNERLKKRLKEIRRTVA